MDLRSFKLYRVFGPVFWPPVWRGCVIRHIQFNFWRYISSRETWNWRILALSLAWLWSEGNAGNERSWSDLTPATLRKLGFKLIRENESIGCVSGQDFLKVASTSPGKSLTFHIVPLANISHKTAETSTASLSFDEVLNIVPLFK